MNALPNPDASRVVAYILTSSAEQGKAYGPDVQCRAVRSYADAHGLQVVATFHEDISGTTRADDRPGMQDAIAACFQHGAANLLVSERSRLARDEYVAHDALRALKGAGLGVLYADGGNGQDDAALLMDGIGHVIAAHDRRRIVARHKAGRDAKAERHGAGARAQGGKLPVGYRRTRGGLVEIDPDAAEVVRSIFQQVKAGGTIRAVAADVGIPPSMVDRIVRREVYKQAEPGRIIDPRVWNATQEAMTSRRRSPGRATSTTKGDGRRRVAQN